MSYDVIVVGAGLAGLSTALQLTRRGLSVLVLEARDRAGGRNYTAYVKDVNCHADLGGMWVGPTQKRLIALAEALNVKQELQFHQGAKVMDLGLSSGALSTYTGLIPPLSLLALLEIQFVVIDKIDNLARQVPLHDPWQCPRAEEFDRLTLAQWAAHNLLTSDAALTLELACQMLFGVQSADLSFLYFLFYTHSAGGMIQLLEVKNAAQHARFIGGAQQLSEGMVELIEQSGKSNVKFMNPVSKINQTEEDRVTVTTKDGNQFTCRRCVFAIPPTSAIKVEFEPQLPFIREQLCQRTFMGSYSKFIVFYDKPFWRENGLSGEAVNLRPTHEHPILSTLDHCSEADHVTALVGFCTGDIGIALALLDPAARKATVLKSFARFFGSQALNVIAYAEKQWSEDEWSRGCPVNVFGAGAFQQFNKALRTPVGKVHFAGTETATTWTGYMEGALESAERVTFEVIAALNNLPPPSEPTEVCIHGWINPTAPRGVKPQSLWRTLTKWTLPVIALSVVVVSLRRR